MGHEKDKTLKNTSINIPKNIFERVDTFAQSVGINRNSAFIYLISRGLDYEYDFENYMSKRKKKVNPDVVVPAIEKCSGRRPYHEEYNKGDGKPWLK